MLATSYCVFLALATLLPCADGISLRPAAPQQLERYDVDADLQKARKPWHPRFSFVMGADGSFGLERKDLPTSAPPPSFLQVQTSSGPNSCECADYRKAGLTSSDAVAAAAEKVVDVPPAVPPPVPLIPSSAPVAPVVDSTPPGRGLTPMSGAFLQEPRHQAQQKENDSQQQLLQLQLQQQQQMLSATRQQQQGSDSQQMQQQQQQLQLQLQQQQQMLSAMRQQQQMRAAESDLQRQQGQLQRQMLQIQQQMDTVQREEVMLSTPLPLQQDQLTQTGLPLNSASVFNQMTIGGQPQMPMQQMGQVPLPQIMEASMPPQGAMIPSQQAFLQQQQQQQAMYPQMVSQQSAFPPNNPMLQQQAAMIQEQQQAALMRGGPPMMMAQQYPMPQQVAFQQGMPQAPQAFMQFPQPMAWQGAPMMYR